MFKIVSGNVFHHNLNTPVNEQLPKDSLIMAEMATHLYDIYFQIKSPFGSS